MPDYPTRLPREDEAPWRIATLYAIAGWFVQEVLDGEASAAFGGYFRLDQENGHLDGQLVDYLGAATIVGSFVANELVFVKTYQTRESLIEYRLQYSECGWLGSYLLPDGSQGKAFCQITEAVTDAFGLVVGPSRVQITWGI